MVKVFEIFLFSRKYEWLQFKNYSRQEGAKKCLHLPPIFNPLSFNEDNLQAKN